MPRQCRLTPSLRVNVRQAALQTLLAVIGDGVSLSLALPRAQTHLASAQDKALCQEISYGVLRWLPRLRFYLDQSLKKPIKDKDRDIELILLIGLYQLFCLRLPPHAVGCPKCDI